MLKELKKDFFNNSFRSFITLFFYRVLHSLYSKNLKILLFFFNVIYFFVKIIFNINSQISYKAKIGSDIRLPHVGFGVVISSKAIIGNNVTIYHLVTIGINEHKCKNFGCVSVGDNCYIGTGAKIISSKVGNNCKIGVNAVVYTDIKDNSLVINKVEIR